MNVMNEDEAQILLSAANLFQSSNASDIGGRLVDRSQLASGQGEDRSLLSRNRWISCCWNSGLDKHPNRSV